VKSAFVLARVIVNSK